MKRLEGKKRGSMFWRIYNAIVAVAIVGLIAAAILLLCNGCVTTGNHVARYDREILGPPDLVQRAKQARAFVEHYFDVTYNRNFTIGWEDDIGSGYRWAKNDIGIDKGVKKDRLVLSEHVLHEVMEMICWHYVGPYKEHEQPKTFRGKRISKIIVSWDNHYR